MSKNSKLRFAVIATDVVAFRINNKRLEILVVTATSKFFKDMKALPGGLVKPEETTDQSAIRHLTNKGGFIGAYVEQLYTFSDIDRDPRGRVVSVGHIALLSSKEAKLESKNKETDVCWCSVKDLPKLAYDHDNIASVAIDRLRTKVEYSTIIRHLLPKEFTLTELQNAYESILGRKLDKRNFRRKIIKLSIISKVGRTSSDGVSRPAELYHFAHKGIKTIEII